MTRMACADRDGRWRLPAPGRQAAVLRGEVGALGARCRVGGLDQAGAQPGASLARLAAVALARALVVARTHPGPGREVVARSGNACMSPISATSASATCSPDAGDRVQTRNRLVARAHALGDLGADPGDRRVEEVDVRQLLGPPGSADGADAPDQRLLQLRDLLPQPPLGQLRPAPPRRLSRPPAPPASLGPDSPGCRWRPRPA